MTEKRNRVASALSAWSKTEEQAQGTRVEPSTHRAAPGVCSGSRCAAGPPASAAAQTTSRHRGKLHQSKHITCRKRECAITPAAKGLSAHRPPPCTGADTLNHNNSRFKGEGSVQTGTVASVAARTPPSANKIPRSAVCGAYSHGPRESARRCRLRMTWSSKSTSSSPTSFMSVCAFMHTPNEPQSACQRQSSAHHAARTEQIIQATTSPLDIRAVESIPNAP